MKVFVTGANGFVGAAVCKKLLERGDEVHGLVRQTSDLTLLAGLDVTLHIGSMDEPAALKPVLKGLDVVYHAAAAVSDWGSLAWFRKINVEGTQALMKVAAASEVGRFVFVSSVAVHSFSDVRKKDEHAPQEPTPFPYCQSKREAELAVSRFHGTQGMETVIIRPGDVFGPGDRTSLLKMSGMLEKGQMMLVGGGRALGAFTYVENLADGIILGGTHPAAAGEAFIITDGVEMTWKAYFDQLTQALDLPRPRLSIPPLIVKALGNVMEGVHRLLRLKARPPVTRYLADHLCSHCYFSIDKAREKLGYAPAVEMEEAIARTAAWYKSVVRDVSHEEKAG